MENLTLDMWKEISILMSEVDLDVRKNAAGNSSAGTRSRKILRRIKGKIAVLTKRMIVEEKERKLEKAGEEE